MEKNWGVILQLLTKSVQFNAKNGFHMLFSLSGVE
jgi:hypothetical protein